MLGIGRKKGAKEKALVEPAVEAAAAFVSFAFAAGGGTLRLSAVVVAGLLLASQHRLIRSDDLRSIDTAFFTANGVLSVWLCAATAADILLA